MGGKKKALLEGSIGSGRIAGSLGKRDNIEVIFFDKKSNKMVSGQFRCMRDVCNHEGFEWLTFGRVSYYKRAPENKQGVIVRKIRK